MVMAAEQDQVIRARLPAIGPMPDVVRVDVAMLGAARKAAAAITLIEKAAQWRRDRARLAPDVERLTVGVFVDFVAARIAGQSACGLGREGRAVIEIADVKHVLVIVTNAAEIGPNHRATGFFFPEIAHPVAVLDEAGIAVEYASPQGGKPPEDGFDDSDPVQSEFRTSASYRRLAHSRKLSDVDVLGYDAIFFPGGLGPMVDITGNPLVKAAVRRAWDGGKIVAAVCHGPSALLGVSLDDGTPLVRGRKVAGFSKEEEDGYARADVPFDLETALRDEGALFEAAAPWQPKLMVDGRLITGQNPASGTVVGEAIADALRKAP